MISAQNDLVTSKANFEKIIGKKPSENLDEINQAFVEVTFDPPWNPEMITDEAREKLGIDLSNPQERKEPTVKTEWE